MELIHGDCLEKMREIPDASIDMILCDLPYGTSANRWDTVIPCEPLWEQYKRIIKPNHVIALFGCEPFSTKLRSSNIKNYKYDWIWDKKTTNGFLNAKKRPLKRYENICIFSYGAPLYFPIMVERGKVRDKGNLQSRRVGDGDSVYGQYGHIVKRNNVYYPVDIIEMSNGKDHYKRLHTTQKPVELCEYLIKTYTKENELVLDNCMGSGSTGVACLNTNRDFIGIEISEEIFKIAEDRIKAVETCSQGEGHAV